MSNQSGCSLDRLASRPPNNTKVQEVVKRLCENSCIELVVVSTLVRLCPYS